MKSENRAYLDTNRHHYDMLVKAQIVNHLDHVTRENLLRIIHEEFAPTYMGQLWCPACVADMLKFVYVQYDKWIAAQPKEENRDHVPMTFPVHEKPFIEPDIEQ